MTSHALRPLALFLSACTSTEQQQSDGPTSHARSETAGDAQAPHDADDVAFAAAHGPEVNQLAGTLRGAEFDRLWLESMISHRRGAVEMAEAEIARTKQMLEG